MVNIKSKLSRLESRLQNLVEAGTAHIIPSQQVEEELRSRLFESIETGIQFEADGTQVAPDCYKLIVQPEHVSLLIENQLLLASLVESILQRGKELGVRFNIPPTINVSGDVEIVTPLVKILSQISPLSIEKTNAIEAGPDLGGKQTGNPRDEIKSMPSDAFLIVNGKLNFPLKHNVLNIGRRIDNHLVIDDPRVSRLHAQLRLIKGIFVLFDLASVGGTFVNNERIQQYILHPGDVISLAGVMLVFGQNNLKSADQTQEIHLNLEETP
jgi:hypothetical protein